MNSDTPNPSADAETVKTLATGEETVIEDAFDPRDLVMKSGQVEDREELIDNPAVAPQMPDDFKDLRGDLRREG